MGLKVFNDCCNNCLLSKDRIVSGSRAKEILNQCFRNQSHFICHKASMNGEEVVCKAFFDRFGYKSQMIRIAERLNALEFVPQVDTEKLPTYSEMSKRKPTATPA